ncbi:mycothiol system anti-sigma-R factor [Prauserella rugosa]|uniref:Mycothiol system anti-sigma-R factor n=1 Tax=Prauserella rugosa TaxID=43354 RepID=A0A660CFP0_9PSEU|nr:mycothiol system anti-sigma-R factor [Prauserella rugosa]KID28648.1 mycothiol system anti-sigma-R factor [Prauserella sp. Am3]KMS90358.1 anti-sigma factor [Streptomyces regensis]TWH20503.1 mycothiol system anti-sigma-R factor [Prauserella rugosa]
MSTLEQPEHKPEHERQGRDVCCDEALAEIYLLLDRECSQERDAELRKHIEDCPPCLEEYGIDDQIKQLLHRKCGGDQAPVDLKERLRASIRKTVEERGGVRFSETELTIEQVRGRSDGT